MEVSMEKKEEVRGLIPRLLQEYNVLNMREIIE
jgi:hypothetical protein